MEIIQKFYKISGRGWVTSDTPRCPHCGGITGPSVERKVTQAEYQAIVVPELREYPEAVVVSIKIAEFQ